MPLIRNNPNDSTPRPRIARPPQPAQSQTGGMNGGAAQQPARRFGQGQPSRTTNGAPQGLNQNKGIVAAGNGNGPRRSIGGTRQAQPTQTPGSRSVQPAQSPGARSVSAPGARPTPQGARSAVAPNNSALSRPVGGSRGGQGNSGGRPGGGGSRGGRGRRQQQQADLVPDINAVPVNKSAFNGNAGEQATKRSLPIEKRANFTERQPTVRIAILGGLGEIGKNMMAVECGNDIVIIDVGFAFPDAKQPGVDYIIPDVTYLEKNKHKIRGIIITHGHLDHIGAGGYMFPKFPVPVYGTKLTLGMVAKQIEEYKIHTPKFIVMDSDKHERVKLGESFDLELVRVNHTIADSAAVVLRTPAGVIINTGDWRLDPDPLDGQKTDMDRFTQLGDEGVLLLMSDSTSCDQIGRGGSERTIVPTIDDLFGRANGRIIISAFSSSITRMQLIIDATAKANRKIALVGRSLLSNIELCVRMGYIKVPKGLIVRVQDIGSTQDDQTVVMCTGSQGEENSALARMSTGDHQNVKIKAGDTVILSSSVIPGNEVSVVKLIDDLMREGARVFARSTEGLYAHGPVHVGGHARREDTAELICAVRPKFYMPIHGEFHHLVFNAEIAIENNVPKENIFVVDNGDVIELTPTSAKRAARIPAGMVMVDGAGVGDVENMVLRDRLALGSDGMMTVVATVSRKTGRLVTSPDIISRGFVVMKDHEELINAVRMEVRRSFERRAVSNQPTEWSKFKLKLRDEVGDLLYSKTKRNPMVLTVVNEV